MSVFGTQCFVVLKTDFFVTSDCSFILGRRVEDNSIRFEPPNYHFDKHFNRFSADAAIQIVLFADKLVNSNQIVCCQVVLKITDWFSDFSFDFLQNESLNIILFLP